MSTIESIIWHILGYSAIPVILIAGFVLSTLIFNTLVRMFGSRSDD